jgi:hypothetical protein
MLPFPFYSGYIQNYVATGDAILLSTDNSEENISTTSVWDTKVDLSTSYFKRTFPVEYTVVPYNVTICYKR